jgi:hypothetical protein
MRIFIKDKNGEPSATLTMTVVSFLATLVVIGYGVVRPSEHTMAEWALGLFGACLAAWTGRRWMNGKAGSLDNVVP